MHTIELYQLAVRKAEQLGYEVRHENLGGIAGGYCVVRGRKQLFVDLSLTPVEQLEQVLNVLRQDPGIHVCVDLPDEIRDRVYDRRAA